MSRSRLGLEAERLGSRLGLGHEGLVSIPVRYWYKNVKCHDTSNCLESEMSLAPKYLVTAEFQDKMSNIRY